jgi:hypothetical protein
MRWSDAPIDLAMHKTFIGFIAWASMATCEPFGESREVKSDNIQSARIVVTRARIDENRCLRSVHKRICEVQSADAEINNSHTIQGNTLRQTLREFHAKSIITQKNISNAGYENHGSRHVPGSDGLVRTERLNLFGKKEKTMPRLAHHSNVTSGIIVGHDADVKLPFVILFDRFNDRGPACQRHVENVRALARAQSDAIPDFHVSFPNPHSIERTFSLKKIPFPLVHC